MDPIQDKAVDANGAVAGDIEPNPDMNTVDELGDRAGISMIPEGKELNIKEEMDQRDRERI